MNGSDGVMITNTELPLGRQHSKLSVAATVAGNFVYVCNVELLIEGDDPIFDYDNTSVHIQGSYITMTII